ncbi:glycosyltransferase family 2 protein [Paraburkholderia sp. IW21]|uniref:glycosyltransferase family 2 protein n=1 Tax=Paraburkholderia sp. IW21 TaxID=3242488 RepID=UPI0035219991
MSTANRETDSGRFGAVVVFFHPDHECIQRANRLATVMRCVVVDNTPLNAPVMHTAALDPDVVVVSNHANLGIATAQNQGVNELLSFGVEFAFLFDQDSDASDQLLRGLISYFADTPDSANQVALAGPAYFDSRFGGVTPFVRFMPFRIRRVVPQGTLPIDVDFLISSGSCVNLKYWNQIGPMEDDLFIDFVDVEWCLRAKRRGFRIVGLPWLVLTHSLGERPVKLLNRFYPMHSPIRRYYQVRNVLVLLFRKDVTWVWKSREALRLPIRILIYICKGGGPTRVNARMVWRGIQDGLRARLGPFGGF